MKEESLLQIDITMRAGKKAFVTGILLLLAAATVLGQATPSNAPQPQQPTHLPSETDIPSLPPSNPATVPGQQPGPDATPQLQEPAPNQSQSSEISGTPPIRVMVGKSVLINVTNRLRRVAVTDPNVADVQVVTPMQVLVHGRSPGEVSLMLWDENERSRSFDVGAADSRRGARPIEDDAKAIVRQLQQLGLGVGWLEEEFVALHGPLPGPVRGVDDGERLPVVISDDGVGLPEGFPLDRSEGLGLTMAEAMAARHPQIKVLRQWAGPYDVIPDNNPILGRTPGLPNMLQMSGFVGHGFMMAPAVTEAMATWMTGSGKVIDSRMIGWSGSASVSPGRSSATPTLIETATNKVIPACSEGIAALCAPLLADRADIVATDIPAVASGMSTRVSAMIGGLSTGSDVWTDT